MSRRTIERNISYDEERHLFYVHLDYGKGPEGARVRQYRTFSTLAAARQALHCFEADRSRSRLVPPAAMTLGQWLEYWLREVVQPTRAASTAYGYRNIVHKHLLPRLGGQELQRLTPVQVQHYYSALLQQGLSPNTVRRHHDLLSSALRTAQRSGLLPESVMDRVSPPRQVKREPCFYTPEDLRALYAAAERSWLEPAIKLAGFLGLRREELCGLKWSSVSFDQRNIKIKEARTSAGGQVVQKETKNPSSVRVLYLPDPLYRLLQQECLRQEQERRRQGGVYGISGHVVIDTRGRACSPNGISRAFSRFVRRHGLPKITLHGLRHSFATVASAQGVPLFEISRALGHSTPTTTGRIYTHLIDPAQTSAIAQVAAAVQ